MSVLKKKSKKPKHKKVSAKHTKRLSAMPTRTDDVPVTSKELKAVTKLITKLSINMDHKFEILIKEINALNARADASEIRADGFDVRMKNIEARMDRLEARMDRLEARMDRLEERMDRLEAKMDLKFEEMKSYIDVHMQKMLVIIEEQNARNKSVMDAQSLILDKLFTHDERIRVLEKREFSI